MKNIRYCIIAFILFFSLNACTKVIDSDLEERSSDATLEFIARNYSFCSLSNVINPVLEIMSKLDESLNHRNLKYLKKSNRIKRWEISIINASEANAFSLGAGRIIITTSLIKQINSEAELASILAHEMAHQLLAHNLEALESSIMKSEGSPKGHTFFSKEQELQADTLGVKISFFAGYDPSYFSYPLELYFQNRKSGQSNEKFIKQRMINIEKTIESLNSFNNLIGVGNSRRFLKLKTAVGKCN